MVIVDIPIRAFKVKNRAVSATFFSPWEKIGECIDPDRR